MCVRSDTFILFAVSKADPGCLAWCGTLVMTGCVAAARHGSRSRRAEDVLLGFPTGMSQ